ncbi:MAG: antibiotic biosynthesis monooxygenase [Candidatus Thermoplasmatota archaeon]|nr:antibiotic biosynthesis monooxygenase [Candidatus Thermoplasmatota archaeon]
MILVQNHLLVRKEYAKQFEDAFRSSQTDMTSVAGFIRTEILRPVKGNEYIVATYWNSMEDFNQWVGSDQFRSSHSKQTLPRDAFEGQSTITLHEIV